MTYEIGQKVLIEANIVSPRIDSDGDVKVCLYGDSDDWTYISAANIREMPVEPVKTKVIEFSEVKVGDVVRVTQKHADGTEVISTGTVTSVPSINLFKLGDDRGMWFGGIEENGIELISRPEPIKVGDKIALAQVRTLPACSVITLPEDDDQFRTVTGNGLHDADFDTTRAWTIYNGMAGFTVKYIAE